MSQWIETQEDLDHELMKVTLSDGDLTTWDRVPKQERTRKSGPPNKSGKRLIYSSAGGQGSAEAEFEHETYYEAETALVRLDTTPNNEGVLELEEYVAAQEGNMAVANRTPAAGRQLLNKFQAEARTFSWGVISRSDG